MKKAFEVHLSAIIERSERFVILGNHCRRLLNLLEDQPDPGKGESFLGHPHAHAAAGVLDDAAEDMREWQTMLEPVYSAYPEGFDLSARGPDNDELDSDADSGTTAPTTAPSVSSEDDWTDEWTDEDEEENEE